ncbi:PREDICTED: putative late blight resistance protein homolog R1B-17 [Ipomoea nil]|uniref:putative late blight resistance protein homolog R1B-17 n=1 Tax=Ipomoea nil TaxID=35883 RepID=UPI000901BCAB|nr:PREDICTED: putative late blight resistance protein homolog R1B-17 [Ipomoea nil]
MDFVLITSLLNTLQINLLERFGKDILFWDGGRDTLIRHKEKIESLRDKIRNLQAFLEDSRNKITRRVLESEIRGVARDAEDKIESELHQLYLMFNESVDVVEPSESLYQTLKQVKRKITSIERRIQIESKNSSHSVEPPQRRNAIENIKVGSFSKTSSSEPENNVMVGCADQFDTIVCKLTTSLSKQLQVISVVGMGGIGKTTLIKKVFEDATIATHFDVRAWATVSQKHNLREMLIQLLGSNVTNGVDNNNLANELRKKLMGQRYLIVMDDIWETKAWDDIHGYFPEDFNGSRILLTTRLKQVADYSAGSGNNNLHINMRFLNPHESWSLFYKKVFEEKNFSIEFETIGRGILENCQGLPLTIIVVAGLLTSFNEPSRTQWENIAENLNSFLNTHQEEKCSKILSLSYDHLPLHLKVCFLYFGIFPEDSMICVKKLIMLWVAEGFLKFENGEIMEKIGETYLQDLVDRGLVQIVKWSCDGKIKSCKLHDLLHNFCLEEARRENLLDVINENNNVEVGRVHSLSKPAGIGLAKFLDPKYWIQKLGSKNHMRMSTGLDGKACRWISSQSIHLGSPISINHTSHQEFRSILYFPKASGLLANYSSQTFRFYPKLLRVMDLSLCDLVDIPSEIVNLVSLRYLALRTNAPLKDYKWFMLRRLQTFIIETIGPNAPGEVWKSPIDILDNMPQLRHVMFRKSSVCLPKWIHHNLQSISCLYLCAQRSWGSMGNYIKFPCLKKLGIYIDINSVSKPKLLNEGPSSSYDWLNGLGKFSGLEYLKIDVPQKVNFHDVFRLPTSFPLNIKKLTLQGTCLPWDDMAIIATLPNLEALKLKRKAFCGSEWKTTENGFYKLKYLKIAVLDFKHWSASFPVLECLILDFCRKLKKFPIEFADITTLQLIELTRCDSSLVTSAKQIHEKQLECLGYTRLVVRDYCTLP